MSEAKMNHICPFGWKVCYENEPCYLCVKSQRDAAVSALDELAFLKRMVGRIYVHLGAIALPSGLEGEIRSYCEKGALLQKTAKPQTPIRALPQKASEPEKDIRDWPDTQRPTCPKCKTNCCVYPSEPEKFRCDFCRTQWEPVS